VYLPSDYESRSFLKLNSDEYDPSEEHNLIDVSYAVKQLEGILISVGLFLSGR